ncbi:MAG: CopD family protein [Thiohalomonadaceae bacterium]
MSLAISLHLLAALLWVGGMFFAHQVLRPVAAARLEPPARLTVWKGVFDRFFPWVWLAIAALLLTGFWIIFAVYGGMGGAGWHVHAMLGLGTVMMVLFAWLYFVPYRALSQHVAAQQWPAAGDALARIRRVVGTNLLLGLTTSVIAAGGRYL